MFNYTGNSVTDRFNGGHKILVHDAGLIRAVGIYPEIEAVNSKP